MILLLLRIDFETYIQIKIKQNLVRVTVNCELRENWSRFSIEDSSNDQTIPSVAYTESITLGAGEEIFEVAGSAGDMVLDGYKISYYWVGINSGDI